MDEQKLQLTSPLCPIDAMMVLFIDVAAATMWGSIYFSFSQNQVKV